MLESPEFIAAHRVRSTDFTRRRSLTFATLVNCLLQGFTKGLQSELDDFFARLAGRAGYLREVSKSAFSQARKKLKYSAFRELNTLLLTRWREAVDVPRWHGWRLLAADTSTLRLPNTPEVVEAFGTHGDRWGGCVPMAVVFGLYDVASDLMVDASLHHAQARERDLLANALDAVACDDLLLLDRGFPGFWLFAWLLQHQSHFCMRVDAADFNAFKAFASSGETETVVSVDIPRQALRKAQAKGYDITLTRFDLRLIRVPLRSGQTEYLVTSLCDTAAYPADEFADLYHQRWRIEENFKLLKCRLAVEHFSSDLPDGVLQDFHAKVWLGNLTASMAYVARGQGPETRRCRFKPNLTYAVSAIRAVLPRMLAAKRRFTTRIVELLELIANTVEWVRPERSCPRPRQAVKPTRHRAYKPIR